MLNYNEKLNENEASIMLRDLHTIKGSARSVGLKFLAKKVHVIEDAFEPIRISLTNKEKISFDINNK